MIYRAPRQHFEQRTGAEDGSRKRHCDVPFPKRCSQDTNFCFTLSCCNQTIKRYQASTSKTKYAFNSCVRVPGSKRLALKTNHQDIQKLVKPTRRWTSSGYPLIIEWRRRMELCPYSLEPWWSKAAFQTCAPGFLSCTANVHYSLRYVLNAAELWRRYLGMVSPAVLILITIWWLVHLINLTFKKALARYSSFT